MDGLYQTGRPAKIIQVFHLGFFPSVKCMKSCLSRFGFFEFSYKEDENEEALQWVAFLKEETPDLYPIFLEALRGGKPSQVKRGKLLGLI